MPNIRERRRRRKRHERKMTEYEACFTYEPNQEKDECCGASGRKFRRVCIHCPNYERWMRRRKRENEGKDNGNESKDVC